MISNAYCIIRDAAANRLDETESLVEAVRIARSPAREGQVRDPISIEHRGKVIRQLVLMPDGKVEKEAQA